MGLEMERELQLEMELEFGKIELVTDASDGSNRRGILYAEGPG